LARFFVLLAWLVLVWCAPVAHAAEPSARQLYKDARKAEKSNDISRAYLLYSEASAKDPSYKDAWVRAQALRRRAVTAANAAPAISGSPLSPPTALEVDIPAPDPKDLEEARRPQPPFELAATPGKRDFDLRGDSRALYELLAKEFGLQVVFDGDYTPTPPIRFRMTQADYHEAFYGVMVSTGTFIVPISNRVFMVVKDTEQKRREVENHVAISVRIPHSMSVQEAQELGRSVQQLMEIQKFAIDSTQRTIVMRDRASKVRPAQALLEQLLMHKAEVALEVELLSMSDTRSTTYGLSLPTDFPLVPFANLGRHAFTTPSGFLNFFTFGGGNTFLGLGISSAQLLANYTRSSGRSLMRAELRSLDGMPASFHAGDKYPIVTMAFLGGGDLGDQGFTLPPTFTFEDLGLVLKITPRVHDSNEVTLEVESEFKVLGSTSFNGIPVIGNRKFTTRVRLAFDQTAMIAGLMNNTQARVVSGLAGIVNIPIANSILSRNSRDQDKGEVLLTIKPRLLSLPASEAVTRPIFVGTESRMLTPL
jgi:type II secretory pathway component HofQ